MAVVSVKERAEGRSGDRNTEGGSLRRIFVVQTDNPRTAQATILSDPRIPQLYSYYYNGGEIDLGYVAKNVSPQQVSGSLTVWEVTVQYEPMDNEDDKQADPALRPAVYTWSHEKTSHVLLYDRDNEKVANTLGDIFEPPVEIPRSERVLIIERSERTFDPSAMDEYVDTINKSSIFGYEDLEGKIERIDGRSEYDPTYGTYWAVTYEIHFRRTLPWVPRLNYAKTIPIGKFSVNNLPSPWYAFNLNVGYRYKRTAACDLTTDKTCLQHAQTGGFQDVNPIALNQDNTKLAPDDDVWTCIFNTFDTKSWTPLKLDVARRT